MPCEVRVFPLPVTRQCNSWPESHQRTAEWFKPDNALSVIELPGLRALIAAFVTKKSERKTR